MTTISVSHHDLQPVETADGNIRVTIFAPDVDVAIALEFTPYEAGMHGMALITIGAQIKHATYQREQLHGT